MRGKKLIVSIVMVCFALTLFVGTAAAEKVLKVTFLEAKMLVTQQYTQFVTDPVRSLEAILRTDLYELGIHYIATFGIRIERISPEIFQRGLNASFPGGNFIAVIATPTLEIQDKLNSLGNVELLN